MNVAVRKLALLERHFAEMDERARMEGYSNSGVDKELQRRVVELMDKVRLL